MSSVHFSLSSETMMLATELRHELHRNAELSNHEFHTKEILITWLRNHTKAEVNDRGQWFYAVCRAKNPKKRIAFRADMDALPIDEKSMTGYSSKTRGVAHKCGHDGHSAILAAFAYEVSRRMDTELAVEDDVFFLFQHAEEVGDGAKVCCRLIYDEKIDEIFGIHNMPGLPLNQVAVHTGTAAFASKGLVLSFKGLNSHASQPEKGKNPAYAIAKTILKNSELIQSNKFSGIVMSTIIAVELGSPNAFGTSAGFGRLMLTIRTEQESELLVLQDELMSCARNYAEEDGIELEMEERDVFPETFNHADSAEMVRQCCKKLNLKIAKWDEPFRSSEDFGYYTKLIKGAIIYLGCGENHAPLHTVDYDFDDEIIETGVKLFLALSQQMKNE